MPASLVADNLIEFCGDAPTLSTLPECSGAAFVLAPGFDLSIAQPQQDLVASLILDGERPYGTRAGNMTITLPIAILAPDRDTLASAREFLLKTINQKQWTLTWTREGGLPMVLECFRALPTVVTYSILEEDQFVSELTLQFQALPYGHSDMNEELTFASPAAGTVAPVSPITVSNFSSVSGTHFTQSTQHVIDSFSAHWDSNGGSNGMPTYTESFSAKDFTGESALTLWVGLGTDFFGYYQWHAGTVTFTMTLRDSHSASITFSTSQFCTSSSNKSNPNWQQISFNLPSSGTFDFTQVTGYTVSAYNFNFGTPEMTADTYYNGFRATPPTSSAAASVRGTIVALNGILGSARAMLNLVVQQAPVSIAESVTYSAAGAFQHVPEAGVTSLGVAITAPGGNGASETASGQGAGGSGGGFTKIGSYPCTPGVPISGFNGTANVSDSWWDGADLASAQAIAHRGLTPAANATTGAAAPAAGSSLKGTSITTTVGAAGSSSGAAPGAGGAAGAVGGNGTGAAGGAAGAAGNRAGNAGTAPGGGGAGATSTGAAQTGGAGGAANTVVTWTRVLTPFKTFIGHRPGPDSPQSLMPFVDVGDGLDTPNNGTEYTVQSLVAGQTAKFGGSYGVYITANSFGSPTSSSHTVTVTFTQYEYAWRPGVRNHGAADVRAGHGYQERDRQDRDREPAVQGARTGQHVIDHHGQGQFDHYHRPVHGCPDP